MSFLDSFFCASQNFDFNIFTMTAPPSKSAFVIIQVHSGPKVLKSWYGLTLDGSMTISDLYFKIKDGEIDPENPIADLAGLIQFSTVLSKT